MVSVGRIDVGSDILMAIHAELPLRGFVEHCVARGTVGLNIGMVGDDLARHKHGLDILCQSV